jgi:hypothetical protein
VTPKDLAKPFAAEVKEPSADFPERASWGAATAAAAWAEAARTAFWTAAARGSAAGAATEAGAAERAAAMRAEGADAGRAAPEAAVAEAAARTVGATEADGRTSEAEGRRLADGAEREPRGALTGTTGVTGATDPPRAAPETICANAEYDPMPGETATIAPDSETAVRRDRIRLLIALGIHSSMSNPMVGR